MAEAAAARTVLTTNFGANWTVRGMVEPFAGVKLQEFEAKIREGDDLLLGQIGGLPDARVIGQIAGRSDHDAPDIAAEADGDERGVRQMADAQGDVDALIDQVDGPVQQEEANRNGRIEIEKIVDNRPQYLLAGDRRRRNGQCPAGGGAFARGEHVGLLQLDQHPPTGSRIALTRFAQLERPGGPMQQLDPDMGFQKGERAADRGR